MKKTNITKFKRPYKEYDFGFHDNTRLLIARSKRQDGWEFAICTLKSGDVISLLAKNPRETEWGWIWVQGADRKDFIANHIWKPFYKFSRTEGLIPRFMA